MIDLDDINITNNDQCGVIRTEASQSQTESKGDSELAFSSMSQNLLTCMLITANVGTIFEDSSLLDLWFEQLRSYLTKVRPQLVAIHCQEVGGKNYESSMKHVSTFTDKIIGDESTVDYNRVRIFLDENFESVEKFTALGSLYLIHKSVENIKLYNFKTAQYEPVVGIKVYAGNSINKAAEHVEKVKFPQELFPECRWSRKGFMRTRWLLNNNKPLDLVNIHLFHDASNLVAMEKTPSPYAQYRQQALKFALDRLAEPLKSDIQLNNSTDPNTEVPLFIFGDFNFRLDTNKVIQKITDGVPPVVKRKAENNEVVEIIYHKRGEEDGNTTKKDGFITNSPSLNKNEINSNNIKNEDDDGNSNYIDGSGVVMTVGKKKFDCENLDETFRATKNTQWLLELDNELDKFKSKLFEFRISFSPSYPFKEDTTGGYSYMKTRCPAWCDRILFNGAGCRMMNFKSNDGQQQQQQQQLFNSEDRIDQLQSRGLVLYRLMGELVPMGDHKPVLLYFQLSLENRDDLNHRQQQNNECGSLAESTLM